MEIYGGHTMEPGETLALRWPFQPLTAWGGAIGGSVTAHAWSSTPNAAVMRIGDSPHRLSKAVVE